MCSSDLWARKHPSSQSFTRSVSFGWALNSISLAFWHQNKDGSWGGTGGADIWAKGRDLDSPCRVNRTVARPPTATPDAVAPEEEEEAANDNLRCCFCFATGFEGAWAFFFFVFFVCPIFALRFLEGARTDGVFLRFRVRATGTSWLLRASSNRWTGMTFTDLDG